MLQRIGLFGSFIKICVEAKQTGARSGHQMTCTTWPWRRWICLRRSESFLQLVIWQVGTNCAARTVFYWAWWTRQRKSQTCFHDCVSKECSQTHPVVHLTQNQLNQKLHITMISNTLEMHNEQRHLKGHFKHVNFFLGSNIFQTGLGILLLGFMKTR